MQFQPDKMCVDFPASEKLRDQSHEAMTSLRLQSGQAHVGRKKHPTSDKKRNIKPKCNNSIALVAPERKCASIWLKNKPNIPIFSHLSPNPFKGYC